MYASWSKNTDPYEYNYLTEFISGDLYVWFKTKKAWYDINYNTLIKIQKNPNKWVSENLQSDRQSYSELAKLILDDKIDIYKILTNVKMAS